MNDRAREVGRPRDETLDLADIDALKTFYNYTCLKCGANPAISPDHVKPLALGGTNTLDNLQLLCDRCNKAKADTEIDYRNGKVLTSDEAARIKEQKFQEKYGDSVKIQAHERAQKYIETFKENQSRIKKLPYFPGESKVIDELLTMLEERPVDERIKIEVHNRLVAAFRFISKPSKRPYISDSIRDRVYALTDGFCFYCGSFLPQSQWDCDHLIPFSKGGSSELTNLVPACENCNSKKSDKMPNNAAIAKFKRLYVNLKSFQATGNLQENGQSRQES